MARLLTKIFCLVLIGVQAPSLHALSPSSKTAQRYKNNCEGGQGLGCYSYARVLWNIGHKKEALYYFARGCDLKYKLACQSYHDHSTITRTFHKKVKGATPAICFSKEELKTANLSPNPVSKSGVQGQKITDIAANSFWAKAGIQENDIIVKMNNQTFNSTAEILKAFSVSGKTFGFELVRDDETVTLWYTCH